MTKYHQQAQATNNKRTIYRAELKQDNKGMFTLTPVKVHKDSDSNAKKES
jgi:hypothetical protein|tara:strand:+ start:1196 stop:1345 length:150 start_codon:yes stop_codon:yes gene_type:complete